ncbi:MAG: CZB domain-containing protein [Janthinobacterium lividum]
MNSDEIKQDFESALVKHLAFKARLRSFLYGNNSAEGPLRDPAQCVLGQWIAERRRGAYRRVPEMDALDEQHRHIHQQANQLMDLFRAGQPDKAKAGFADVQHTADVIMQLLQTIEASARTATVDS